ncbi:DUF7553 family protein [Halegenticoccus tardaugens]|uniref:DUF7553 family protein n=1 Tax=Halegenticoccus tardaugens TaxID=2071624 RepID=UPI00100AE5E5|nr:hypothetical protein [Halegenticoccus tardaugens]
MNAHFKDAWYYLKRAGQHLKAGVEKELRPVEARVRRRVGREREPEPGRFDKARSELKEAEKRAEEEAKEAFETAKERVRKYRGGRKKKAA